MLTSFDLGENGYVAMNIIPGLLLLCVCSFSFDANTLKGTRENEPKENMFAKSHHAT